MFTVRQNRDLSLPAEKLGYFQASSNSKVAWDEDMPCNKLLSSVPATSVLCLSSSGF